MNALLQINGVTVEFTVRGNSGFWGKPPVRTIAVDHVSLELEEHETLGVVGESGSGKTTLIRTVVGTVPLSGGQILWRGTNLAQVSPATRQQIRKDISMVFQNPIASLNPSMTIGQIIAEPRQVHFPQTTKAEIRQRVGQAMEWVGLAPGLVNRYPHEFSGGQCQRVGIARALITQPALIICDEPVASLDVSIRAQVINLLQRLQNELGISLIMISHDLSTVRHISHRIMIMYRGTVMEVIRSEHLFNNSRHPYTRALVNSIPVPDPKIQKERNRLIMPSEPPSMEDFTSGCKFASRCPISQPDCSRSRPALMPTGSDHLLACPHASAIGNGSSPTQSNRTW